MSVYFSKYTLTVVAQYELGRSQETEVVVDSDEDGKISVAFLFI